LDGVDPKENRCVRRGTRGRYLLLLELVGAEDREALRPLVGGQPVAGAFQLLEHLLDGDALLQTKTPLVTGSGEIGTL
jgi:hypothetical protein